MKAILLVLCAAVAFFVLFSPWTQGAIHFFPAMAAVTLTLAAAAWVLDRQPLKAACRFEVVHIEYGIWSAALLYGIFWAGHFLSVRILPFAAGQVDAIYALRAGENSWIIAGVLIFVIAPAEEFFWRGFIQRRLANRYGVSVGVVLAAGIYALVHGWSLNLMLVGAAAVCGVFWGTLFAMTGSLWPGIISHALWDVTIFILWPVT